MPLLCDKLGTYAGSFNPNLVTHACNLHEGAPGNQAAVDRSIGTILTNKINVVTIHISINTSTV